MTPDELDHAYTQLCEAMARVGEAQAPLFLAMVSLALIARQAAPGEALAVIAQAEAACGEPAARPPHESGQAANSLS